MAQFIKKLFTVLLVVFSVFTIYFSILYTYGRYQYIHRKNLTNISGIPLNNKKIFILGHSHPQCAINDSLLDNRYINLATGGEPLFYTCMKARELIKKIPDAIMIIEFSDNSLLSINGVLDDKRLLTNYKRYLFAMNADEHIFLWKNNPLKSFKTILSMNTKDINHVMNGGYYYSDRFDLITKPLTNTRKNAKPEKKYPDHLQNVNYLKLLELIKNNPHTKIILIRVLQHTLYTRINKSIYQQHLDKLTKYPNCQYIDFDFMPLSDSSFTDIGHLNYVGANIFTPFFKQKIDSLLNNW